MLYDELTHDMTYDVHHLVSKFNILFDVSNIFVWSYK